MLCIAEMTGSYSSRAFTREPIAGRTRVEIEIGEKALGGYLEAFEANAKRQQVDDREGDLHGGEDACRFGSGKTRMLTRGDNPASTQ